MVCTGSLLRVAALVVQRDAGVVPEGRLLQGHDSYLLVALHTAQHTLCVRHRTSIRISCNPGSHRDEEFVLFLSQSVSCI